MAMIDEYIPSERCPDFHAVDTISLGELYEEHWIDFSEPSWHWNAYNEEQYNRVNTKIINHYYSREIGVLPPLNWKREFLRKMNEIMPKYIPFYKALEEGSSLLQTSDNYGKNRNVFSDFPATQIAPTTQDYASNANDYEYENITTGDMMEKIKALNNYDDIDYMIIKEIDSLFSCFISVNLNI